jgi:NADH:ubiquinone oxidoreductase subunit C
VSTHIKLWSELQPLFDPPLPDLQPHGVHDHAADLPVSALLPLITTLRERDALHHLTAITAVYRDDALWLLYHLWVGTGLTLRVCPGAEGGCATLVPSLREVWPIAEWYEREIHDLYGLGFLGHEQPKPLLFSAAEGDLPPMAPKEREQ